MHFNRDHHLRLGSRQLNLLRFEHYKRVVYSTQNWRTLILRFILRDEGLSFRLRALSYHRLNSLTKASRGTRHSSRCWVSGRARQVSRKVFLARMHYRAALSGGFLPHLGIKRP
jgi:ribosomal protein S14